MLMRRDVCFLDEAKEKEASLYSVMTGEEENDNGLQRSRMKHILSVGMRNELTDRQKSCVYDYYFTDLSVAEIAEKMQLSTATVYKHIRKAKQRLKKCVRYL